MNLDTPPSIDDEVACVWFPGVLAKAGFGEGNMRREPSWPAFRLFSEAVREMAVSIAVGLAMAIADMEDMVGGGFGRKCWTDKT